MKLKHTVLTLSLLAATAIAASGCSRGVNVIDFAGHETASNSESVTPTENTGDIIVPENTGTTPTDSGTTTDTGTTPDPVTPTDPGSGAHEEKYCPAGTVSEDGNGTLCCRIDDPQVCMIIDPGPGGRPHFPDHLPETDVAVDDPTTPPDHGGGGYDGSDGIGCHFESPVGTRRVKVEGTQTGEGVEDLDTSDCIMLRGQLPGSKVRERLSGAVRDRVVEVVRES